MPRSFGFLVVALIVCSGQMCGVNPLSDPTRLDVTEQLRAACPNNTDPEIKLIISAAEADRLAGWSYPVLVDDQIELCRQDLGDTPAGAGCQACLVACINQVYGVD